MHLDDGSKDYDCYVAQPICEYYIVYSGDVYSIDANIGFDILGITINTFI